MKRLYYVLSLLIFAATSCGKNGLYINMTNTYWEIHTDNQRALVSFMDDEHASIVQVNMDQGYFQTMAGTYEVDGHAVGITAGGSTTRMIRTFSHFKNSKNKNLSRISAQAPARMAGSVWAVLEEGDLHFSYFQADGTRRGGTYTNVSHKEGYDYGWSWEEEAYSLSGYQLQAGRYSGSIFEGDLLVLATCTIPMASSLKADPVGESSLTGSIWRYETSGYPGFIIFTSSTEFTRILVMSEIIFETLTGTYTLNENSLAMDAKELQETCIIEDGSFTYLNKTYVLVED